MLIVKEFYFKDNSFGTVHDVNYFLFLRGKYVNVDDVNYWIN